MHQGILNLKAKLVEGNRKHRIHLTQVFICQAIAMKWRDKAKRTGTISEKLHKNLQNALILFPGVIIQEQIKQ